MESGTLSLGLEAPNFQASCYALCISDFDGAQLSSCMSCLYLLAENLSYNMQTDWYLQSKLGSCLQLPEPLTGKIVSLDESKGAKAILVMFICNHCPFVSLLTLV